LAAGAAASGIGRGVGAAGSGIGAAGSGKGAPGVGSGDGSPAGEGIGMPGIGGSGMPGIGGSGKPGTGRFSVFFFLPLRRPMWFTSKPLDAGGVLNLTFAFAQEYGNSKHSEN